MSTDESSWWELLQLIDGLQGSCGKIGSWTIVAKLAQKVPKYGVWVITGSTVHCLVLTPSNAVRVGNRLFVLRKYELNWQFGNKISLTDHQPDIQLYQFYMVTTSSHVSDEHALPLTSGLQEGLISRRNFLGDTGRHSALKTLSGYCGPISREVTKIHMGIL